MLLFKIFIDKIQMSRPPECAATLFKTWRSILVGHLGLQSVTYRVDTPCTDYSIYISKMYLIYVYSSHSKSV